MIYIKKFILYFIIFIFICFIFPALCTKQNKEASSTEITETENNENTNEDNKENQNETTNANNETANSNYEYTKYATIKLLHAKTKQVEEVKIDDYIINVVSAEMPADYELEALKAQAVVARTYTIYKAQNKKHDDADICDDFACCQAWITKEDRMNRWKEELRESNWNKITQAVKETQGKIVTYEGKPINAFFHSNSGGTTEVPVNVWGGTGYPYLQTVETAGEEQYSQYSSEVVLSKEELLKKLKEKYSDIKINFDKKDEIKILEHTDSGRVKTIKLGNKNLSGVEIRTLLGLKSTNFEIQKEKQNYKFIVKGYGHGVGMSQTGANSMAKTGSNYEEIIKHFYTSVEITDINSL